MLAWDLEGSWFKSHDEISAAAGPLSEVLNPHIAPGGDWPLPSLINCKSRFVKATAKKTLNVKKRCATLKICHFCCAAKYKSGHRPHHIPVTY